MSDDSHRRSILEEMREAAEEVEFENDSTMLVSSETMEDLREEADYVTDDAITEYEGIPVVESEDLEDDRIETIREGRLDRYSVGFDGAHPAQAAGSGDDVYGQSPIETARRRVEELQQLQQNNPAFDIKGALNSLYGSFVLQQAAAPNDDDLLDMEFDEFVDVDAEEIAEELVAEAVDQLPDCPVNDCDHKVEGELYDHMIEVHGWYSEELEDEFGND